MQWRHLLFNESSPVIPVTVHYSITFQHIRWGICCDTSGTVRLLWFLPHFTSLWLALYHFASFCLTHPHCLIAVGASWDVMRHNEPWSSRAMAHGLQQMWCNSIHEIGEQEAYISFIVSLDRNILHGASRSWYKRACMLFSGLCLVYGGSLYIYKASPWAIQRDSHKQNRNRHKYAALGRTYTAVYRSDTAVYRTGTAVYRTDIAVCRKYTALYRAYTSVI